MVNANFGFTDDETSLIFLELKNMLISNGMMSESDSFKISKKSNREYDVSFSSSYGTFSHGVLFSFIMRQVKNFDNKINFITTGYYDRKLSETFGYRIHCEPINVYLNRDALFGYVGTFMGEISSDLLSRLKTANQEIYASIKNTVLDIVQPAIAKSKYFKHMPPIKVTVTSDNINNVSYEFYTISEPADFIMGDKGSRARILLGITYKIKGEAVKSTYGGLIEYIHNYKGIGAGKEQTVVAYSHDSSQPFDFQKMLDTIEEAITKNASSGVYMGQRFETYDF